MLAETNFKRKYKSLICISAKKGGNIRKSFKNIHSLSSILGINHRNY